MSLAETERPRRITRLANTRETYGLVHQLLHWITAGLILLMIPLGIYMSELPDGTAAEVADKVWLYSLHKTLGIAALVVAIVRIGWAVAQPHPNLIHGGWEAFAAKTVHWLLYAAIIAMPVFGWLHHAALDGYAPIWFWPIGDTLPGVPKSEAVALFFGLAHKITGVALISALVLHVGGALKHALIDKDRTLARMVPGAYVEVGVAPSPKGHTGSSIAAALLVLAVGVGTITGAYAWLRSSGTQTVALDVAPSLGAWTIDKAASKLEIEVTQLGSPVRGVFNDWEANVTFDPGRPEDATIVAEIAVPTLALSDVSDRAVSDEFLGAEANPTARFVSDDVVPTKTGFDARGTLTLAGVERPFTLPFTFAQRDGRAVVNAEATIRRLDFGVGKGFADDSSVGREVLVLITIEATRERATATSD